MYLHVIVINLEAFVIFIILHKILSDQNFIQRKATCNNINYVNLQFNVTMLTIAPLVRSKFISPRACGHDRPVVRVSRVCGPRRPGPSLTILGAYCDHVTAWV